MTLIDTVEEPDPTEAGTVAAAYTPNDQEQESTTTPGVPEKSAAQKIQDSIDIKRIEDEMKSQPRPTKDDDDDKIATKVKKARENGNRVENGKFMFIYQANQSFSIWNNVIPKIDEEVLKILE